MNITQPEMIPTIKSIWKEFLPWFYGSEVSIGADEYEASLANDYIDFVNTMADYIHQQSGKVSTEYTFRQQSIHTYLINCRAFEFGEQTSLAR